MKIRYFSLALAIAFGVMLGNLGSSFLQWSIAAYMAKEVAQDMAQAVEETSRQQKQDQVQRKIQAMALTKQQRENSPKGKALRADCNQWKAQAERMDTKYVQQEIRNRCAAFERYLSTGK